MTRKVKLTPRMLKKLVLEEKKRVMETLEQGKSHPEDVKADETEADEFASTLEADVDHLKAIDRKSVV